jgi:catechol 2,3-dioxygenase-like lactoylglutathione lyase family enzyme
MDRGALDLGGFVPLIQVFDMPRSVAFYRDILGFTVAAQSEPGDEFDWALLRRDQMLLMLNTAYERDSRPPAPDPARIAAHVDTAFFFDCPDPDAAYSHLRERGISVRPPVVTSYGMKQVHAADPDGYELCFQRRAVEGER